MSSRPLRHLDVALDELARRGLLRTSPASSGAPGIVLCSNDYLGYAAEPCPEEGHAGGAGASRLVSGTHDEHRNAERAIAAWLRAEQALLFTSGYAANLGAIAALARPGDVIVSDALNHASIIDGCRLSGARVIVVPHLDAGAADRALASAGEAARRWMVTESYFSMDGDIPDLPALRRACDAHDAALFVDEAHAIGVFGPRGAGLCAEAGVTPDILVGTLGKSLGLQGAFVAGSSALCAWLWNRARSFVFSTGLSPMLAAAASARVARAAGDDAGRARLAERGLQLREGLDRLDPRGLVGGRGPIVPWLVGDAGEAVGLAARLRERGVVVQAIRPPTVPEGTSRLRLTVSAALGADAVDRALRAFAEVRG